MSRRFSYLCIAAAVFWTGSVLALTVNDTAPARGSDQGSRAMPDGRWIVAQNSGEAGKTAEPVPGELVIPQDSLKTTEPPAGEGERNCMTVCVRWGEECVLINKGAGGMERKCRRTCKQLGEECL